MVAGLHYFGGDGWAAVAVGGALNVEIDLCFARKKSDVSAGANRL